MGWALKSPPSRRTKFTDKQKQYLNVKFQIGERTGKKAEPTDVSKAMRTVKDSNGGGYSVMAIFSRASKLAVAPLALLLSEVLR